MISAYLLQNLTRGSEEFYGIFSPKLVCGEPRAAAIKAYPNYIENDAVQAHTASRLFRAGHYSKVAELRAQNLDDAFFMVSSECQSCVKSNAPLHRSAMAGDVFVNWNQKYLRSMFGWIAF